MAKTKADLRNEFMAKYGRKRAQADVTDSATGVQADPEGPGDTDVLDLKSATALALAAASAIDNIVDPLQEALAEALGVQNPDSDDAGPTPEMAKQFTTKERDKLASSGAAMSDGSFPISSATDLHNAISDWGRAGSRADVKAHIIKRAKVLGLESQLPAGWSKETATRQAIERAFVVESKNRLFVTGPAREIAFNNPGFMNVRGRLVEADNPNGNGALWKTKDLELGQHTVAGGPLNWLHQEQKIVGCLTSGNLVTGMEAASQGVGNHIASDAVVWEFLFPREAAAIQHAADANNLFLSMECISREVACVDAPGHPGCGSNFSYDDYDAGRCCSHLREKSSIRHFVDPMFLGAAIVVPPVRPGWAHASATVVRQAAALVEEQELESADLGVDVRELAAAILTWSEAPRGPIPGLSTRR